LREIKFKSDVLVYLASPYTSEDVAVRAARHAEALRAAAAMEVAGWMVFSPIAYGHQFAEAGAAFDWDSWSRYDQRVIRSCDVLCVLQIDGWARSRGVAAEVGYARSLNRPVWHLVPGENGYLLLRGDGEEPVRISQSPP